MKKVLLTLLFAVLAISNADAVLKEENLGHTIHVLRLELYNKWMRQKEIMKRMDQRNSSRQKEFVDYMKRANTASLMLYSQDQNFTFDMAYACQEVTTLYHQISTQTMPFNRIKTDIQSEIARYDSLICVLQAIPPEITDNKSTVNINGSLPSNIPLDSLKSKKNLPFELDKQGIEDRKKCIEYATTLRENLRTIYKQVEVNEDFYAKTADRIGRMNKYAQEKYAELQQSIFINRGDNYFKILKSSPQKFMRMKSDFNQKYLPLKEKPNKNTDLNNVKIDKKGFIVYPSEWRGGIVLFASIFMILYILIAGVISNIILRWLVPKRFRNSEDFRKKRPMYIMTGAIFIFTIAVMIARNWLDNQNLMLMATGLMIEMAWLMGTIYVSMLIRLTANQMKEGAKLYDPFIFMSMIVVWFRIILIPNTLVDLIFPPVLLIFTIWQISILIKCKKKVPTTDRVCCSVSLAVMVIATVLSFIGFTLMAVQLLLWWMFQLAAIATITCLYDLMEMYEDRVIVHRIKKTHNALTDGEILDKMRKGRFVGKTWIYDFFNRALVPVCAVFSILFSVFMAAEIFDLRDLCIRWFMKQLPLYGTKNEILFSASAFKISLVVALYFVFKYLNYLVRSIWFSFKRNEGDGDFNATLARNIIGICIWGIYIIACFLMLKVPATGIALVLTGLSTGLGFASQSLLENFFYGISLMTGRVRVGDYIECEGITGKVESITYQSTQIITLDGSVVAIRNADLFSKNFKNLTRNHQYVLVKIPVGVAYGTNINNVREMLVSGISKLCRKTEDGRDIVRNENGIKVAFSDFGDSSVNLFVMAWVLVDQKLGFTAEVNETIYNILNENHIEIPFPQTDLHIRRD